MRRWIFAILVLALAGGGVWWLESAGRSGADATYRTAAVSRGEISASVNATGTVSPTNTVIVGSQLSGKVVEILADWNSEVKAGQIVARLDVEQTRAKLDAARADWAQAKAARLMQDATVDRMRADVDKGVATGLDLKAQLAKAEALLVDAQRTLDRQSDLLARGIGGEVTVQTARTLRDTAKATRDSAAAQIASNDASIASLRAQLKTGEAQVGSADALIDQKLAVVRQIDVDIANSEIRAPVDGVIIQRNIELGQPVAASLQAPTLFLLAENLRNIEVQANVDEADVGRVKPGQTVSFTVNAYPGRTFEGVVKQVRLGAQTVQNVVTYTTVISVENRSLALYPGMTATLRVLTDRHPDVLRAPNAALRWKPANAADAPAAPVAAPGRPPLVSQWGGFGVAGAQAARSPEDGVRSGGGARGGGGRQLAERLKAELDLTGPQRADVDSISADLQPMLAGLGDLEQGERRQRMQDYRRQFQQRVEAILTPAQAERYAAIRAGAGQAQGQGQGQGGGGDRGRGQPGRVYVLDAENTPRAIDVRLGASDGTNTEILAGALDADAKVIIGGGPKVDGPARGAGFPRPF